MTNSSIIFKEIRVNEMGSNSGIFIGNNRASLWGSFSKTQTALDVGNGKAVGNRSYFWDRDRVDFIAIGPFKTRKKRIKKGRTSLRTGGNVRPKFSTTKKTDRDNGYKRSHQKSKSSA